MHGPVARRDARGARPGGAAAAARRHRRADGGRREAAERRGGRRGCATISRRHRPQGRGGDVVGDRRLERALPVAWAAQMGLPLVDADSMGRAFPEVQMVSQHVAGRSPDLFALTDVMGSVVSTVRPASGEWAERICRAVTVAFGGTAADGRLRDERRRGARRGDRGLGQPRAADRPRDGGRRRSGRRARGRGRRACGCSTARSSTSSAARPAGFARGSVLIEGTGADAGRLLRSRSRTRTWSRSRTAWSRVRARPDLRRRLARRPTRSRPSCVRYGQRVIVLAFAVRPDLAHAARARGRRAAGVRLRRSTTSRIEELHAAV